MLKNRSGLSTAGLLVVVFYLSAGCVRTPLPIPANPHTPTPTSTQVPPATSSPTPDSTPTFSPTSTPTLPANVTNTPSATNTPRTSPTAQTSTSPTTTPVLMLSKSESATTLSSGQTLTYSLTFSSLASNVVVTDTVPSGLVFDGLDGAVPAPTSFSQNGSLLTWTYNSPVQGTIVWLGVVQCVPPGFNTINVASVSAAGAGSVASNPVTCALNCLGTATPDTPTPTATPTFSPTSFAASSTPTATLFTNSTSTPSDTDTPFANQTSTPTNTPAGPTPTQTVLITCVATNVAGDYLPGSGATTLLIGNTSCQRYNLAQTSVISQVYFDIAAGASAGVSIAAGIYSDGGVYPNNLLWNSASQPVADGWNSIAVPQVQLTSGNYWLALTTNKTTELVHASGSTSTRTWEPAVFPDSYISPGGPSPTPMPTPPPSSTTDIGLVYAAFCY